MSTPEEAPIKGIICELAIQKQLPASAEPASDIPASRTFATRTGRRPNFTAKEDMVIILEVAVAKTHKQFKIAAK